VILHKGEYFSILETGIEEMWNHEYYKILRMDLINGVRNNSCDTCWKIEDAGGYSYRQKSLQDIDLDENIVEEVYKNNGYNKHLPKFIDLKIGNLCNLKCVMCNQVASSKIEEEVNMLQLQGEKLPAWQNAVVIAVSDLDESLRNFAGLANSDNAQKVVEQLRPALETCQDLELLGGETFVNPFAIRLLKELVSNDLAKNINIKMISNFTLLNKKQLAILKKFRKATLVASYDHVDAEKLKAIRFPTDYKNFKKNFNLVYNDPNLHLDISTTFSVLNILDFEEIFNEFKQIYKAGMRIGFNFVNEPKYLDIKFLEESQKKELIQNINRYCQENKNHPMFVNNQATFSYLLSTANYLYNNILDFDEQVKERTRVFDLYKKIRGTDFKKVFPVLKEYR
jgi:MoaA/NifB/PqqE/SkfB family radical SAM enzyme